VNNGENEREQRLEELAYKVLSISRDTLLVNLRYLDMALNMLKYQSAPQIRQITTDGKRLYYDPISVLEAFKRERTYAPRLYLHMIMHCVFRHMFVSPNMDRGLWDIACDIAIEGVITELEIAGVEVSAGSREASEFFAISSKANGGTAEKIYAYLRAAELSPARLAELSSLFSYDSHEAWYSYGGGVSGGSGEAEKKRALWLNYRPTVSSVSGDDGEDNPTADTTRISEQWGEISERMQEEIQHFLTKRRGNELGNMLQNLREVNRERYDYSSFLRKFAVRTEVMKINDDEFDYVFYTYGMRLYDKMPLIEPLEYKEEKRIREFVIAIDTSGSTSGELVQTFMQKTFNILKSSETFASRVNIHIIQCDAEIQEDVKITSREEFDRYMKEMKIKGLGGTDFRPVFECVQRLRESGELTAMKGLIYFTDGEGVYPAKKPDYDTAFVFIDDEYTDFDVPPWAIKLVLKKDEI